MRIGNGIALLLLLGLVCAQAGEHPEDAVEEADLWTGRIANVARSVGVRLEEGGRLMVKKRDRWRSATLEEFGKHLRDSAELYDKERRAQGKSGYEGEGSRVSRLVVEFDAHPETPWQHVCWVMIICAEEKLDRLRLKVKDRTISLFLPEDSSAIEQTPEFLATVHVIADLEVESKWGEIMIKKPTTVKYRVGGKGVKELADVSKYLEKVKKEAAAKKGDFPVGRLRAMHKVPVERVVDVFDAFLRAGIQRLDFIGRTIPAKPDRRVNVLRYPANKQ